MHRSFSCAMALTATSALADPPSQTTSPLRDRTRDEFVPKASNDDTAVEITEGEPKQLSDREMAVTGVLLPPPKATPGPGVVVKMIADNPRVGLYRMASRLFVIPVRSGHGFRKECLVFDEPLLVSAARCNTSVDPCPARASA